MAPLFWEAGFTSCSIVGPPKRKPFVSQDFVHHFISVFQMTSCPVQSFIQTSAGRAGVEVSMKGVCRLGAPGCLGSSLTGPPVERMTLGVCTRLLGERG